MINKRLLAVLLPVFIFSCTSLPKHELSEAESRQAEKLIASISDFNHSSASTLSSSFTADGNTGEKKFRVEGRAVYDKKGLYKITIVDYVFRSPVLEAHREMDTLYFYYPAEKRLLIDDANKIDLYRYTGFKTDYRLLYKLFTGSIPLLDNYLVYKCVYDGISNSYSLIIQNDDFYETVFFRNNLPEKILFIHKLTKSKGEIYLSSPLKKGDSVFYRKYAVVIPEYNIRVSIKFNSPVLNSKVEFKKFNIKNLPAKTEVIKVN